MKIFREKDMVSKVVEILYGVSGHLIGWHAQ